MDVDQDAELDQLVAKGLELQHQIEALKVQLGPIAARAIALAKSERVGDRKDETSIKLVGTSGICARVIFAGETRVDQAIAIKLKDKLPEDLFGAIFARKVTYGLGAGYGDFMKSAQPPRIARLRKLIGSAINRVAKAPSVKFIPAAGASDDNTNIEKEATTE